MMKYDAGAEPEPFPGAACPASAAIAPLRAHRSAPEDRLNVLALTIRPEGTSPGQRFRLEQWAPHLAVRHGIRLHFVPFESPRLSRILHQPGHRVTKASWLLWDVLRRGRVVLSARRYDAVVIYREASMIGPALFERLLWKLGVPFFFDFDDAIWGDQPSPVNGVFSKLHFWGKTATTCRLASGISAGNDYLAAYASQRNPNVRVVPTSIDLSRYHIMTEPAADQPFTVCWTGSTTTLPLLEYARPALERFARQRPLRVKVICNLPPKTPIAGAENLFIPWDERTEVEELSDCHVGIMPLPDDSYMRGKCGLKALQFMATGRPVILSPVGLNRDLIDNGRNGFLATDTDEWVGCLLRLADSAALRQRIGLAGRATVERHYSAELAAERFGALLRETLKGAGRSREAYAPSRPSPEQRRRSAGR